VGGQPGEPGGWVEGLHEEGKEGGRGPYLAMCVFGKVCAFSGSSLHSCSHPLRITHCSLYAMHVHLLPAVHISSQHVLTA
jgi:hypothetical protein